jgi:predicted metal-dependent hydrolase
LDGRVTLTLPNKVSEREGLKFAHEKADWLRKNLSDCPETQVVGLGGHVLFRGVQVPIVVGKGRAAQIVEGALIVPGAPEMVGKRVEAFLKTQARLRLGQASDHYAQLAGRSYGKISVRDTRSRWGSCSSQGNLMYSWRLIMAPDAVLDYVAAHEVAHLVHMDHSDRFWAQVHAIFPDYKNQRRWLRENGSDLHHWQFSA